MKNLSGSHLLVRLFLLVLVTISLIGTLAAQTPTITSTWLGEDATYPSEVTTSGNDTLLMTGLGFRWMHDWWGETIVSGGSCKYTISGNSITIPLQKYCITAYGSTPQPEYSIQGTGSIDSTGAFSVWNIRYDFIQNGASLATLCMNYGWPTAYFEAVIYTNSDWKTSTVKDSEGNSYYTVSIGTQEWMAQNLKATRYNNGDVIGTTSPPALDITAESSPKYQWAYAGNENNVDTYGRLYTWHAVTDNRNVCPTGWHVPKDAEWTVLTDFLGGNSVAGGKLKESGIVHWLDPNSGGNNESGFTALPGGIRDERSGAFYDIGREGGWWSSTEYAVYSALVRNLNYGTSNVERFDRQKYYGFSVRCLRDTLGTIVLPVLTTYSASKISSNSAISGADILYNGGAAITASGICWSTNTSPTITDNITSVGTDSGFFSCSISGLSPNTTYYLRAYATNSLGTAYGNEVSFTTYWAGFYEVECKTKLSYFHPTAGGSYPNEPYGGVRAVDKTLLFIADGVAETWFALWSDISCWITINADNSIGFEVANDWLYTVLPGDPNDPTKISHLDPETGIIYLYYYYVGTGGSRIFWEVFTPPPSPQAPNGINLANTFIPFKVKPGTVVSSIYGRDINQGDTLTLQLVPGYGDNSYFQIQNGLLSLPSGLNFSSPMDLNIKVLVSDNTGLSAEYEAVIHANTDEYEIQSLCFDESANYVKEISVINQNVVWAEDWFGQIGRTVDGGLTWDIITPPVADITSFGPLFAIDSLTAWLVASQGDLGIYKTADGGASWIKQTSAYNPSSFPDVIYFWNKNEGFTLGDPDSTGYVEIYTTQNGGQNWVRVTQDKLSPLMTYTINTQEVVSVCNNTVWVSGAGYLYRSTDKGFTWDALASPEASTCGAIVFVNGNDGIYSIKGTGIASLYATHDGGESWSLLKAIDGLSGYSQNFCAIPGTNTIVMTDNNSLFFSADIGNTWKKIPYEIPNMHVISASDNQLLWGGGWRKQVYKVSLNNHSSCSAAFTFEIDSIPGMVSFASSSIGFTDYFWTFGDGNSSTLERPTHNYSTPGYYQVSLSVRNSTNNCMDMFSLFIQIGIVDCRGGFTCIVDPVNTSVNFSDISNGIIDYFYWDFGDGSFSVLQNPDHLYKKAGIYLVSQTVIDNTNGCIDQFVKPVQVGEIDCSAFFVYYIESSNYTGYFSNRILGEATALLWSFGDGGFSTQGSPVHVFPGNGIYSVGLNTYDFNSGCMDYYQDMLIIGDIGTDCEADFLYYAVPASPDVRFINKSIGDIVGSIWNFGDGSDNSTDNEPVHTYTNGGYYNVCLTVTNSSEIKNMGCKWVLVEGCADNDCRANFMFSIDSANLKVTFADNSFGTIDKYTWDFGDSNPDSVSALQNPYHTYSKKGYYLVKLTAENTATGCKSDEYKLLNVGDIQVLKAAFDYEALDQDKKRSGYPVDLFSACSGDGATVEWDFGDGQKKKGEGFTVMDSTSRRVTHYYEKPGKYSACVRISDPVSNQSDTYCQWIFTKNAVGINPDFDKVIELSVYPNPFIGQTTINYVLPESQVVEIAIFDQLGRRVETLINSKQDLGNYRVVWNSRETAPGVYHLNFVSESGVITRQLVISK